MTESAPAGVGNGPLGSTMNRACRERIMITGGAGRGKRLPLIKSERLDGIQSVRRPPYTTEER